MLLNRLVDPRNLISQFSTTMRYLLKIMPGRGYYFLEKHMHSIDKNSTHVVVFVSCSNCQNEWVKNYYGGIDVERAEELASEGKCPDCGH
jgi:hypothetical protein